MLVRYRLNSTATLQNFQTDLNNIITGAVSSVNDLSAGCDKTNSAVYGTYPSGIYTRVNNNTYTYSKVHNAVNTYTHYFRFTFDASKLTTWEIAQSYTAGSDTLVNSSSKTVNIQRFTFDPVYPVGIDIVVSNKCIFIQAIQSGSMFGIFDIGHNGVTRQFSNSMLMIMQDMQNVINYGTNGNGITIPYTYSFDTLSYTTNTTSSHYVQTPLKKFTATSNIAILENPVYITSTPNGSVVNLVYGLFKIPTASFSGIQIYKDSNNLYRLTLNDYSILVD